jgi:hypothetical protein
LRMCGNVIFASKLIKNCFVNERYYRRKNFNKNRDKKLQKIGMTTFPRDFMHKNFMFVTKD